jgi:hypothetical protein
MQATKRELRITAMNFCRCNAADAGRGDREAPGQPREQKEGARLG